MNTAKYIKQIEVTDPDQGAPVHVSIYKHCGGGMFGVDSSFLESTTEPVYDPFNGKQLEGEEFSTE